MRPQLYSKNSIGRRVSILNDHEDNRPFFSQPRHAYRSPQYPEYPASPSPRTPDLTRADSFDSHFSRDSPMTPMAPDFSSQNSFQSAYPDPSVFETRNVFGAYPAVDKQMAPETQPQYLAEQPPQLQQHHIQYQQQPPPQPQVVQPQLQQLPTVRPAYERPATSFDSNSYSSGIDDRNATAKRYPCRYKDSHQCDKTFTTSGHASRHSKIHTAEKAVNCTFPGCMKKFTRADNMKQHLETHYKERSRGSASKSSGATKLTMPAGVKKSSSSGRISRPESRTSQIANMTALDTTYAVQYPNDPYGYNEKFSPQLSPRDSLDMAQFQNFPPHAGQQQPQPQLHGRTSSDSCGLDALAAAAIGSGRQ